MVIGRLSYWFYHAVPSMAGAAGVVMLFGALIGYSITAGAMGFPYTLAAVTFWGAVGVAGGPVFGAAGYGWRSDVIRQLVIGVGLLGGVFVAEGWFMIQYNQDFLAGWVSITIGLLLPILLARSTKERLYTLLVMVPITGLGMGVYSLISGLIYT